MSLLNWYIKQLSKWKNCENSFSPVKHPLPTSLANVLQCMEIHLYNLSISTSVCVRVVHISTHLTATLKLGTSLANEMYHAYATLHSEGVGI